MTNNTTTNQFLLNAVHTLNPEIDTSNMSDHMSGCWERLLNCATDRFRDTVARIHGGTLRGLRQRGIVQGEYPHYAVYNKHYDAWRVFAPDDQAYTMWRRAVLAHIHGAQTEDTQPEEQSMSDTPNQITPEKLYVLLAPERFDLVRVQFEPGRRHYTYMANHGKYEIGDRVVVPAQREYKVVTVTSVDPVNADAMQAGFEYKFVTCQAKPDHEHDLRVRRLAESQEAARLRNLRTEVLATIPANVVETAGLVRADGRPSPDEEAAAGGHARPEPVEAADYAALVGLTDFGDRS